MTVALFMSRNAQATGIERYVDCLVEAMRAKGLVAEEVVLQRRELRLGRARVGGNLSVWAQRALSSRRRWSFVHALDPAAALKDVDLVTVHDLIPETHRALAGSGRFGHLDWALSRRNAKRAKRLVAVSGATRDEIVRRWGIPAERIRVIYPGIDPARWHPVAQRSDLLAAGKPTLAYVGDDNPRKNLILATRALLLLRERHGIDARLVRVGPTRYAQTTQERLAFARERGLDVVEAGFLPDGEVRALLSGAAAFVWPSLAEGFGSPPMEALACGCPVVSLDIPVNREVQGDAARFHAPTPESMADAIAQTLRAPPARDALVAHAARFTYARAADETLALYREMGAA